MCCYSVVKLHDAAQPFAVVGYAMQINAVKSCKYEEYYFLLLLVTLTWAEIHQINRKQNLFLLLMVVFSAQILSG